MSLPLFRAAWLPLFALLGFFLFAAGCKSDSGQASATATTAKTTEVSTAEITIDGKIADWAGLEAPMQDAAADSTGSDSQELVNLYLARNGNQLYVLLEFAGDLTFPHDEAADSSYYGVTVTAYRAGACTRGNKISGYQVAQVAAEDTSLASSLITYSGAGVEASSKDMLIGAKGRWLELAIPVADLPAKTVAFTLTPKVWSLTGEETTQFDKDGDTVCFAL